VIKRPRVQLGQMPFELPSVRDDSKPSILLHKNSRYLLFKPQTVMAAAILADVMAKVKDVPSMRNGKYWHINQEGKQVFVTDWKKIEIWKHLGGDVASHPLCQILQSNGVEIGVVPTLAGYIKKEYRRFQLENTPYPTPAVTGTASLFERCSIGTNLRCIRDYVIPDTQEVIFTKDKHYMVVSAGGEGIDSIKISKQKLSTQITLNDKINAFEWSEFNAPMEEYFDDSEDMDLGPTVADEFPGQVAQMRKRIDELGYALFEHVKVDAAMEAMKRSTINGKLMRMGKTSEAISVSTLWGSRKIAVFGSKNVCLTWETEFKRLGITDFVMVDTLADLDKPGRYYLMRYGWARNQDDPSKKARKDHTGYLRAGERSHQIKVIGTSKQTTAKYSVLNHHPCPHCRQTMVRPLLARDATGKVYRTDWTPLNGYMCRNQDCSWTTDNRKKKGAAWTAKGNKLIQHKPGTYIDWGLAAHADCDPDEIKGRQCMQCGQADGVWVPQISKRFKKHFNCVIPDEVHNMKDRKTLTYKAVSRMRARRKYAATGTLVSNGPMDPYWIMHWMFGGASSAFPYTQVKGEKDFEDRFCDHVILEKPAGIDEETGEILKKLVSKKQPFLKNQADWWRFLSPKFLRRNYEDPLYQESLAAAGMFKPDISIQKLTCKMTPDQIKLMLSAMRDFKDVYEKHKLEATLKNRDINKAFVISQMSTMRTIATVPEAMNRKLGVEAYTGPSGGGKMYNITTLARNRVLAGGKVLILSDFIDMQKALETELTALGLKVIRFKTSWSTDERREAMEIFAEDPDYTVMVAGTRAVSESLDFSVADTCICCDLLWAPAFQQQAWSRILQATKRERKCDIFTVLSENSIDEHVFDTFYAKLVASEQSQDRKVVSRRAMQIDIKWFAERVIEEEANLTMQIRDLGFDEDTFILPELGMGMIEQRMV
jgi:hypothetical protein